MSSDHLQRLKELWEKLEPLDPQERQALIEEHRTTDPDVVAEVEQMLFDSGISDEFLGGSVRDEVRPVELEGKTLGEFEVVAEIGRGGSGVVYRAFQPSLTRTVALKVLLPHLTQTDEAVDRFAREARAAAKLDHRHIVPIYAVSTEGEHHFYAMRWVAGPDLSSDHRSDEPRVLPKRGDRRFVSAAVRIVAQVARALEHAHERGIVHRDVKPHNILLSLDGDALLTDFGIARDPSMQTIFRPDQIAGTVAYMSPEQARATGYEDVDHRSDVYSLGVVLYELLTGRLPFEGPSVDAVLLKVRSAEPQRVKKLADIRQDLADVCHQAMAKRPEERYPTAAEMAEDLESILRFGAPKNLIHRSPVPKAWHYVRQNRKRFLVAALVLLAVFGGYGFSAYRASLRDLALLDLRVFDREAQPLAIDGDVLIRPLNEVTGEPATKEGRVPSLIELGRISEGPFSVSPGYGRVVVRFDGDDSFAELTRRFERDESYVLRVYHRASTTVENAVEVGPGMLTRPMAPDGPKSALDGKRVTIRAVFVDQYEVSNAEFREFLRAIRELEGNMRPRHWPAEDAWDDALDSLPVSAVAWEDAQHYAEWAGKRLLTLG
ncbi:MAG: protein kinase, partial [Planctomycetota bacterium]